MLQRRGSSFINGSESVCVCVGGWVLCVCVVCRKKIKYVSPLHPLSSVGGKCPTTPWFQYSVLNKCSEVRSGLRMPQMGPGWHWLWKRDWCVVRGFKLTIIGTWKFVTKSNTCILFCTFEPHFVNYKRAKQMTMIHEFCV